MKKVCRIDGCEKPWRGATQDICPMHYHRFYRNGTYDTVICRKPILYHSAGYIQIDAKDHPLSDSSGYVYEHRKVFYEHNGEGPFNCYICQKEVVWKGMHIDHYDKVKTNNNIENLNACCSGCNSGR